MADGLQTPAEGNREDGFIKGLSKAIARKALVPLAASVATAATAYLTRKSSELWQEKVLPKVREKGGGRAVAKEALETVSGRFEGRGSEALSTFAEKIGTEGGAQSSQADVQEPKKSDDRREEERRERRERRQKRQRALEQSGTS
jgi:hypothetical protein